jgi:hypothetical protein
MSSMNCNFRCSWELNRNAESQIHPDPQVISELGWGYGTFVSNLTREAGRCLRYASDNATPRLPVFKMGALWIHRNYREKPKAGRVVIDHSEINIMKIVGGKCV